MGITGAAQQNALKELSYLQTQKTPNETQIKHWFRLAPQTLRKALEPFGYFRATVKSQLQHRQKNWYATYTITPGPKLRISHLDIQLSGAGKDNAALKKLTRAFPLEIGDVMRTQRYQKGKQKLLTTAEEAGYLDAHFTRHVLQIDLTNYTATIHLHLDTGYRYHYGQINFKQKQFAGSFLKRFLTLQTGDPFSSQALLQLQDNLSQSNYFQSVSVFANRQQQKKNIIPIDITLVPRKPKAYSFGLGFGTDTGPRTSLGWNWRWANAYGHYMSAILSLSKIQRSAIARYVIPGKHPLTEQYNITTGVSQIKIPQGQSLTHQLNLNHMSKIGNIHQNLGLTYQRERSQLTGQPKRLNRYLLPSVTWQIRKTNHPLFTTQGYMLSMTNRVAWKTVVSDSNFFQTEVHGKLIQALSDKNQVVLSGQLGYTISNNIHELPLSLRFFTGGSRSVRGFSYQSIGPGRYLFVASAEFQQRIIDKWYVSTFYDIGDAFDNFSPRSHRATGFGIIWASPVGPIEITLARAISEPGHPKRLQFTMGTNL